MDKQYSAGHLPIKYIKHHSHFETQYLSILCTEVRKCACISFNLSIISSNTNSLASDMWVSPTLKSLAPTK